MNKNYNYLDQITEIEKIHQKGNIKLNIVASELMSGLGSENMLDLNTALLRSFEVCAALKIPVSRNFKKFYKLQNNVLVTDYYLSDLGAYLITINGNTCNPNVAKAQLQYILSSN